jgi:hypothetical protein
MMMNPNENEFARPDLSTTSPERPERILAEDETELSRASGLRASSGDIWEQTREKAGQARERAQYFLRQNPVPAIVAALGVGLAIGWALRHATSQEEEETEAKSRLGDINWSFFSLPFLWPFFRSLKDRYEDSAESVKEGVSRLKKIDVGPYTKPIRKRWKSWTD